VTDDYGDLTELFDEGYAHHKRREASTGSRTRCEAATIRR